MAREFGFDKEAMARRIGQAVRQLRTEQERTQADVADEVGITQPYLSNIERGRKLPPYETLGLLAQALGVSLTELFMRAEQGESPLLRFMAELQKLMELVQEEERSEAQAEPEPTR